MNAIKEARRFIERNPETDNARVLTNLVLALESERSFELLTLYELDYKAFDLALEVLREWRLDRYIAGKAKLFDLSWHLSELAPSAASAPAAGAAAAPVQPAPTSSS